MLVGSGKRQGFKLQLDAQPEEYYGPYSYEATGFKVAIHEPGTYHDIDNEGYDVSPGFYTSIRIKRTKVSLWCWKSPRRQCHGQKNIKK